jgi:hypothetical protein
VDLAVVWEIMDLFIFKPHSSVISLSLLCAVFSFSFHVAAVDNAVDDGGWLVEFTGVLYVLRQ